MLRCTGWSSRLLMVDVDDSDIGPHRIGLSVILRVVGMPGDPEVQIETENTVCILRKIKEGKGHHTDISVTVPDETE